MVWLLLNFQAFDFPSDVSQVATESSSLKLCAAPAILTRSKTTHIQLIFVWLKIHDAVYSGILLVSELQLLENIHHQNLVWKSQEGSKYDEAMFSVFLMQLPLGTN